jgi:hypothetical protein
MVVLIARAVNHGGAGVCGPTEAPCYPSCCPAGSKRRKPGAGRSKELRADPFAAQVQGGNVYLHAGAWVQDFLEEAESFPNSPHKDQVDAAAMAFHHLATARGYPIEIYERVNA